MRSSSGVCRSEAMLAGSIGTSMAVGFRKGGSMFVEIGIWSLLIGIGVLAGTANLFVSKDEKKDLDGYKNSKSENLQPSADMQYAHLNYIIRRAAWTLIVFGFIVSIIGIGFVFVEGITK